MQKSQIARPALLLLLMHCLGVFGDVLPSAHRLEIKF